MLEYPNEIIKLGYNDAHVLKQVKLRLNELGYGPLTPDTPNYGLGTMEVIKKFQKESHLIPDGEIGELTWSRLFTPVIIETGNTLQSVVLRIAKTKTHIREATNHNDGPEVGKILASVGLGIGFPWCMAYVFYLFELASRELGIKNPVPRTGKVMDCYAKAKERGLITKNPKPGDQGIMNFGGGKGHTFIVTDVSPIRVFTNEGNTSADPAYKALDREGNGVFERNRSRATIEAFITYA